MGRNARVFMLAAEEDFALRFAPERFRGEFTTFVEGEWAAFRGGKQGRCSA